MDDVAIKKAGHESGLGLKLIFCVTKVFFWRLIKSFPLTYRGKVKQFVTRNISHKGLSVCSAGKFIIFLPCRVNFNFVSQCPVPMVMNQIPCARKTLYSRITTNKTKTRIRKFYIMMLAILNALVPRFVKFQISHGWCDFYSPSR